ncbi:MAG: hypothetical protein RL194_1162 [Pseudomonadota bacterium]
MTNTNRFKGNKASLPSKICAQCGREMSWRKSWEKNWEAVKYCSDGCRRQARQQGGQLSLDAAGTGSGVSS